MGIIFRRSTKVGRNGRVNWSKSGASYSHKIGPFTINTRGRVTLRLGRGFSIRLWG